MAEVAVIGNGMDSCVGSNVLRGCPGRRGSCFPRVMRPSVCISAHGGCEVTLLRRVKAKIQAYDPTAKKQHDAYPWAQIVQSPLDVCEGADVLAVLTEWKEFAEIDVSLVASRLNSKKVVDGRNVLDRDAWQTAGFIYRGVGR